MSKITDPVYFDEKNKLDGALNKLSNHSFLSSLGFYFRSSGKEARRRKLYFCLAISSILMVVMTTAVA